MRQFTIDIGMKHDLYMEPLGHFCQWLFSGCSVSLPPDDQDQFQGDHVTKQILPNDRCIAL